MLERPRIRGRLDRSERRRPGGRSRAPSVRVDACPRHRYARRASATSPLSVDRLLGLVADPRVGGIALFVGVVRDHDDGAAGGRRSTTPTHPTAEARAAAVRRADGASARRDRRRGRAPGRPPRGRRPGRGGRGRRGAPGRGAGGLRAPDRHPQGRGADLEGTALRRPATPQWVGLPSEAGRARSDPADLDGVRLRAGLRRRWPCCWWWCRCRSSAGARAAPGTRWARVDNEPIIKVRASTPTRPPAGST